jgi:predicted transcriptional regulator
VVAEWIEKAEIREAIARGRQAFEKGDVVSHAEALQRLSKW